MGLATPVGCGSGTYPFDGDRLDHAAQKLEGFERRGSGAGRPGLPGEGNGGLVQYGKHRVHGCRRKVRFPRRHSIAAAPWRQGCRGRPVAGTGMIEPGRVDAAQRIGQGSAMPAMRMGKLLERQVQHQRGRRVILEQACWYPHRQSSVPIHLPYKQRR